MKSSLKVSTLFLAFFGLFLLLGPAPAEAQQSVDISSVEYDGGVDIVMSDSDTLEVLRDLECPKLRAPIARKLPVEAACSILTRLKGQGCTEVAVGMLNCGAL